MVGAHFEVDRKKVLHVTSSQESLDSVAGTLDRGFLPFGGLMGMLLKGGLQSLELLLTFADLPSKSFELCLIERAIEGYQHGPFDTKKLFMGSVGPDRG